MPSDAAVIKSFFDAWFLAIIGIALAISTIAYWLIRGYVRTMLREMRQPASLMGNTEFQDSAAAPVPAATSDLQIQIEQPEQVRPLVAQSPTFRHARYAFRRAAWVYTLGGTAHVGLCVGLLFTFGSFPVPSVQSALTLFSYYFAVFWAWFLIVIISLALFWGPDRRMRGFAFSGYVSVLLALGMLLELLNARPLPLEEFMMLQGVPLDFALTKALSDESLSPSDILVSPFAQVIIFYSTSNIPIFIPVLYFNKLIRSTVGPLFICLAMLLVVSTFLFLDILFATSDGRWIIGNIKRLAGGVTLIVVLVGSFVTAAFAAFCGLVLVVRRFQRKRSSDQMFVFDALWLSISLLVSALLFGGWRFRYLLGLVPFVLYKFITWYGLRPLALRAAGISNARLLYLRVFSSSRRSERLFDLLAAHWRYAGSIQLITATDVARGRFELDELFDFLGGRFTQRFIDSGADLERRLDSLDLGPDPDGRFRVNEFFCRPDTWQLTVNRVMSLTDLVVMDLRGFSAKNKGCIYELEALLDNVPLERIVLLVDSTTDRPFLESVIIERWQKMSANSPNRMGEIHVLRLLNSGRHDSVVHRLLTAGDVAVARSGAPGFA
jgi:hypothetical protein